MSAQHPQAANYQRACGSFSPTEPYPRGNNPTAHQGVPPTPPSTAARLYPRHKGCRWRALGFLTSHAWGKNAGRAAKLGCIPLGSLQAQCCPAGCGEGSRAGNPLLFASLHPQEVSGAGIANQRELSQRCNGGQLCSSCGSPPSSPWVSS